MFFDICNKKTTTKLKSRNTIGYVLTWNEKNQIYLRLKTDKKIIIYIYIRTVAMFHKKMRASNIA